LHIEKRANQYIHMLISFNICINKHKILKWHSRIDNPGTRAVFGTRNRQKTNKTKNITQKTNKSRNTDHIKNPGVNPFAR